MKFLKALIVIVFIALFLSLFLLYGLAVTGFTAKLWVKDESVQDVSSSEEFFTHLAVSNFGEFGDSFGWITAVFAGISVVLIFLTWRSQKEELEITRKQMQFQQVENSLFQMFAVLNDIVSKVKFNEAGVGIESFLIAYSRLNSIYIANNREGQIGCDIEKISSLYDESFWKVAHLAFGHYFRYLYRILRVIDDSALPQKDKNKLAKVVRAQLSDYELVLLFYNVQAKVGKKFERLCYQYDLLDNLPDDIYLCDEHKQIMLDLREKYKVKA